MLDNQHIDDMYTLLTEIVPYDPETSSTSMEDLIYNFRDTVEVYFRYSRLWDAHILVPLFMFLQIEFPFANTMYGLSLGMDMLSTIMWDMGTLEDDVTFLYLEYCNEPRGMDLMRTITDKFQNTSKKDWSHLRRSLQVFYKINGENALISCKGPWQVWAWDEDNDMDEAIDWLQALGHYIDGE